MILNDKENYYLKRKTPGQIIRDKRKRLGWSQDELEWRSGISRTQISRIERGIAKPGVDTIGKLEEALGVSLMHEFLEYCKLYDTDDKKEIPKKQMLI